MKYLPMLFSRRGRRLLIAAALLGIVAAFTGLYSYTALNSAIKIAPSKRQGAKPIVIEVLAGSSLTRVSKNLEDAGYLQHPTLFKLWARLQGVENSIKTGEYELVPGITPRGLLDKLVLGDTLQHRITLVEGWTFQQALEAIWKTDSIVPSLRDHDISDIAQKMGLQQENPEGLLYPDTYFYTKGATDLDLLLRAKGRLDVVLNNAWETRLGALPYSSPYEALTMASIVEKESASNSERALIAGVFVARLGIGMRLQSDPTIIYGMRERFLGNIRREDLSAETAYNTYRINGLPPTPIALSGAESIYAALNPAPSDYLYFVSRGDGQHQFSRTLEEHNAAVRLYQLSQDN
jgi:UPF0755 protein